MSILSRRLAGLLLSLFLVGCSSLNPFASNDKNKLKPLELAPLAQSSTNLKSLWHESVGKSDPFVLTPAVVGDSVYAAAANGAISRFDGGKEIWRVSAGQDLSGGVGSDGKLVVVGTHRGEVLSFDAASGKPSWKTNIHAEILAAPAVAGDVVVVRSGDSRLFSLETATGKRRWVYERSTPSLTLRSNVGVLLLPSGVAAGYPGGKLVLVALNNGALIWEATVAQPKGVTELERVADITSSPVVSGDNICAVAFQGRVACFSTGSGTPLWSRDISSTAGLDADNSSVYVSNDRGEVLAFDISNGFNLWKQDKLINRTLTRPIAVGETIAVADNLGFIHGLNRKTGEFVARLSFSGGAAMAEPQHIAHGLVLQTLSGAIHAVRIE